MKKCSKYKMEKICSAEEKNIYKCICTAKYVATIVCLSVCLRRCQDNRSR